jgi:hypothetical protein
MVDRRILSSCVARSARSVAQGVDEVVHPPPAEMAESVRLTVRAGDLIADLERSLAIRRRRGITRTHAEPRDIHIVDVIHLMVMSSMR